MVQASLVLSSTAVLVCVLLTNLVITSALSSPSVAIVNEVSRRSLLLQTGGSALVVATSTTDSTATGTATTIIGDKTNNNVKIFNDPGTYSSLLYQPPAATTAKDGNTNNKLYPMIVFLHGAGKNERDISNLADPQGEYGGLLPSLLCNNDPQQQQVPQVLLDNFIVVAPYVGTGKSTFYDEPRSRLLDFISHATTAIPHVDPSRVTLFGFSDGATLAVELLTTQRFAAGIICSYGYSGGTLPALARTKLSQIPLWVFHSADDRIFAVRNSDSLVSSLQQPSSSSSNDDTANDSITTSSSSLIRYTRFAKDPENVPGPARGHTTGITASRDARVYEWLLSLPPIH